MKNIKNPAFTLVELIVVIVILAILSTIAFLNFNNYSTSARDSDRLSDMTNISKWLSVLFTTSWIYPIPDSYILIQAGTWYSMYQWVVWPKTLNTIKMSESKDYLDNNYYSYSLDKNRIQYNIWWYLENKLTSSNINYNTNQIYAVDYSKRYLLVKWWMLWILTESWTNSPIEQTTTAWTTIDLITTSKNLILNISSNNIINWTWQIIWILQSNQYWNFIYTQPSSCPSGFIPVPWNVEFNQPWFCVMKYEAKALNWIFWPSANWILYHGHDYQTTDMITSNYNDAPITLISQSWAISACQSMWSWYHLITENEWMTIARNIEEVSSNWSNNLVWSWYLYSWHNDNSPWYILTWSQNDNDWYNQTLDWPTSPWDSSYVGFLNSTIEQSYKWQKRTLNLSNWQVIWDLAWNVWEHVNKSNTINGINYNDWNNWLSNSCWDANWYSYSIWETIWDTAWIPCVFQNWFLYSNIWPKTPNLNWNNWLWRIYSSSTAWNTIFVRWWQFYIWIATWIFSQRSLSDSTISFNLGFRCAK